MNSKNNMSTIKFIPGKLNQWSSYKKDNHTIWIAGDNISKKYNYLIEKLSTNIKINKDYIKETIKNIDDHFGIVVISKNWSFAAVDCARSYPIFWKKTKTNFILSPQAKCIAKEKEDTIDKHQLVAFRMSGYTINEGTLWNNINNLNPGNFIFIESQNDFYIEKHFVYDPWHISTRSYNDFKKQLKYEISRVLKNIIVKANGRTIAVPLSAGLDSRLIASGLKHLNYNNVKCFSYGLKNNFESNGSKIIAKKLGYKWNFVEINQNNAKNFSLSLTYNKFISNTLDGCATASIQGLYAIDILLKNKYLDKEDIIVNGNSGDFISGGHIPKKLLTWKNSKDINLLFDEIFEAHFYKHYALWESLLSTENKKIIKKQLLIQIEKNLYNINSNFMPQGVAEFLEYENRQTKFVANCQRIYEFYNLKWQLPLWDKSFINFWSYVPLKYKIDQKLYKDTLNELNMGKVWGEKYDFKPFVSPSWVRMLRYMFKAYFIFLGKKKWHKFERRYLNYWTDNICGQSAFPYKKIIKNKNGARHYVSWLTIFSEDQILNSNWQNLNIKHDN